MVSTNVSTSNYSFWHTFIRTINPFLRNREDLETTKRTLQTFQRLQQSLEVQDAHSGITAALHQESKSAEHLIKQIRSQWFVSKNVKKSLQELQSYTTACKISEKQQIPFKILANDVALTAFIEKNHLHHKITKQHHEMGLRIKVIDGEVFFPVAVDLDLKTRQAQTEWVSWKTLQKSLPLESSQSNRIAFLANGLELHDSKNWQKLRPLYECSVKDNQLVHRDTLTGKEETIGNAGKNYIQLITVRPWGYNPKGGALFGHTWIRFAIDGKIYHVGADLSGKILNPDFMASIPMEGKEFETSCWTPINDQLTDLYGNCQSERILQKIEALQYFITHREKPESPYANDAVKFYDQLRDKHGGTCTSAAAMVYREISGKDYLEKSRPLPSRILFNNFTRAFLDTAWRFTPKTVRRNVVQPVQIITRGAMPTTLASNMAYHRPSSDKTGL